MKSLKNIILKSKKKENMSKISEILTWLIRQNQETEFASLDVISDDVAEFKNHCKITKINFKSISELMSKTVTCVQNEIFKTDQN